MKVSPWILPTIGLVLVGAWSTHQQRSISTVEEASALLQKRITVAHSSGPDTATSPASPANSVGGAKAKQPLDWKKLSVQLVEMERAGGSGAKRVSDRLEKSLESMSKEELLTALDDVAALGLQEESQRQLENLMMKSLLAKDRELGMTRLISLLQTDAHWGEGPWPLGEAMKEWAAKDPNKATAWFDRQIAAGNFDGKHLNGESPTRDMVEGALAGVLFPSAPDAVSRRLSEMPEDQRSRVLDSPLFLDSITEETQEAFASLIRSQLPEKDQAAALANYIPFVVADGAYAKVTEFMDRIHATPAERMLFIKQAARSKLGKITWSEGITQKSLDTLREWTTTQAPDATDRITGEALAHSLGWHSGDKQKFAQAAEWVLGYHQASGNDDIITSFLNRYPRDRNQDQVRALAARISDPTRREEILKRFQ